MNQCRYKGLLLINTGSSHKKSPPDVLPERALPFSLIWIVVMRVMETLNQEGLGAVRVVRGSGSSQGATRLGLESQSRPSSWAGGW